MTPKQILINDLRRELRWAYKDQSVANIVRFAMDVSRLWSEGDEYVVRVHGAAWKYIYCLIDVQNNVNDETMRSVQIRARQRTDSLRTWEEAK